MSIIMRVILVIVLMIVVVVVVVVVGRIPQLSNTHLKSLGSP